MALLLVFASPQLIAASDTYLSYEGYSRDLEQTDDPLSAPLNTNTPKNLVTPAASRDAHLPILHADPIFWFGEDIWITDVGVLLFADDDHDGYFSGFSLSIDADTRYSHADVFATIDVRLPQGYRERLHTTGTFSIYGDSTADEYRVDIELLNNYPIGDYDLFVNLVDANNYFVLDNVGASEFSNLSRLPLESEELDINHIQYAPTASPQTPPTNAHIRVVEYSGAGSTWMLLAVAATMLFRRFEKKILSRKNWRYKNLKQATS